MSSRPNASPQKRCLSELLGTYLLVLIGPGTVAAVSIAQDISPLEALLIIGFAFAATVALVILLLGRISGAHINPAVTLAHTVAGKTTLEMFLPYLSSQVLGGLLGAFTVKLIFSQFGSPADLGTTKLASGVSVPVGTLLEAAGTFVLAMSGFLASLRIHKKPGEAALIGSTLLVIILALGPLTNASLNPARSLGPALASGYLTNLYIYWIGPLAGGLIAGLVYKFFERPKLAKGPVLFVCIENAGRSQMAEAFAKKHGMNAQSAGTIPSTRINPIVVDEMRERGIDISSSHPKTLTPELIRDASLVVAMGCSIEEACPKPIIAQMQKKLIEWDLKDPKGKPLEGVRKIRDEIESKVAELSKSTETLHASSS